MPKYANFDDYINNSESFAQPLLKYFRSSIHAVCPEVEETFKWGMPMFLYQKSILCHMAAFKKHASFSFWLSSKMTDPHNIFIGEANSGMGQFGKVTTINQMPSKEVLFQYIKEAMQLKEAGEKMKSGTQKIPRQLNIPDAMTHALNNHPVAKANFENFSQSNKNDYIEWISDAKTETTRQRRMTQMLEWLEENKPRNWKYMKKYKNT